MKSIQLVCNKGIFTFEHSTFLEGSPYQQLRAFEKANQPIMGKFWYYVILAKPGDDNGSDIIKFSGKDCQSSLKSFMAQYEYKFEVMPGAEGRVMVTDGTFAVLYSYRFDILEYATQAEFDKIKSVLGYTKIIKAKNHSHALLKFTFEEMDMKNEILSHLKSQRQNS